MCKNLHVILRKNANAKRKKKKTLFLQATINARSAYNVRGYDKQLTEDDI